MANGKQLSQKGADFILDLMDSYIDVKEAVTPCVVRGGERMTEAELEKATGQELIEERDYCGVDGYYCNYLVNVNAEMLKRFNRLAELEEENRQLKKENVELEKSIKYVNTICERKSVTNSQLIELAADSSAKLCEAKKIVKHLLPSCRNYPDNNLEWIKKAEEFLKGE